MFRIVSIIGFFFVLAGIAIHCASSRPKFDELFGKDRSLRFLDPLRVLVYFITLPFLEQKLSFVGVIRKLLYLLALICFVVLVITGFYRPIVLGEAISGYWMVLHATFAPVFAVCLAALAVMWAHNCRFDKNYLPWLSKLLQHETKNSSGTQKYELSRKVCFWLIISLTLPLILSVVLSMFSFFGTSIQRFLLQMHQYTALVFVLVATIYTYLIIRMKMEQ